MNAFKQTFPLFAAALGFLGVVACLAVTVVVGVAGSRLIVANEGVLDRVDESLVAVRGRVLGAQERVRNSRIGSEEIREGLQSFAKEKTSEHLVSRWEVQEKAQRLATGLRQADRHLETSGVSIQSVQQILVLARSLGAPVDETLVDPLANKLTALRVQVNRSTESVDAIGQRAAELTEGDSQDERIHQAAELALRVVISLTEVDSRLADAADTITETQTKAEQLKSKTHSLIVTAEVIAFLLIAWMAAGQVSLCRSGWRSYHANREPLASSDCVNLKQ